MPNIKVKVKWDRQIFSDVDLNTDEEPIVFKNYLFQLTGVPPDRQKILLKGIVVKDSWGNMVVSPNASLILLGSKDSIPTEPVAKTLFLEDMTESELSKASNLPPGLTNLGNTCYINATIQCLRTVPELRTALKNYKGAFKHDNISKENFVFSIRDHYDLMDKGITAPPLGVFHSLQGLFPRFAEKDASGKWKQQDANEFWVEFINILQDTLPACGSGNKNFSKSFIDQYFSGIFDIKYLCTESDSEPSVESEEQFYQLSCFVTSEIKYMQLGLQSKITEKITKHSASLNRDAVFKKICKIKRLPLYLTVQFVRFFYKGRENVNAKVLRDVKFPIYFDAFGLCNAELQNKLSVMRDKIKESESEAVGNNSEGNTSSQVESHSFTDDIGSSNSGLYQLHAVLTHKGRSSSSGHYVAWINHDGMWIKCDDSDISVVTEESILRLSGGGDWHTAYILLYGPRISWTANDCSEHKH